MVVHLSVDGDAAGGLTGGIDARIMFCTLDHANW